jgi:hypothetical protein
LLFFGGRGRGVGQHTPPPPPPHTHTHTHTHTTVNTACRPPRTAARIVSLTVLLIDLIGRALCLPHLHRSRPDPAREEDRQL